MIGSNRNEMKHRATLRRDGVLAGDTVAHSGQQWADDALRCVPVGRGMGRVYFQPGARAENPRASEAIVTMPRKLVGGDVVRPRPDAPGPEDTADGDRDADATPARTAEIGWLCLMITQTH